MFPLQYFIPRGPYRGKINGMQGSRHELPQNSFQLTDKVTYPLTKHALLYKAVKFGKLKNLSDVKGYQKH